MSNKELEQNEVVEVSTNGEVVEQNTEPVEQVETTKPTKVRARKKTTKVENGNIETKVEEVEASKAEPQEVEISVPTPNPELAAMKAELEAMKAEKAKLEEERTTLNETISKLQEEVKITPQKLGQAIKDMGISPLSVSRENPQGMSIERYTAMTDSERREWQRTHKSDYLKMMHTVKLNVLH